MRTFSRQSHRQSSLNARLGTTNTNLFNRRIIDIFIIEGRNFMIVGGSNKLFSVFVRLKFGTNKKYRTQV